MSKIFNFLLKRKFTVLTIIVVIAGIGYYGTKSGGGNAGTTRYVVSAVQKDTLISSISGTGQVSSFHQIDIKPKVSGEITKVTAKSGDTVKSGAVIAYIDSTDALKTVRDAQINLESAKISMEKLKEPIDAASLVQAENSLAEARTSLENAKDTLNKSYDDGYTSVSNAFLDLPAVMTGLNDVVLGFTYSDGQQNIDYYYDQANRYDESTYKYRDDVNKKYKAARESYDKNFDNYKASERNDDPKKIEALIDETYETAKKISEAVKSMNNMIQFYEDLLTKRSMTPSQNADTHLTELGDYATKANSHLSDLFSVQQTIRKSANSITSAEMDVTAKVESLNELKQGADRLDIKAQELTIKQRQNSLADANSTLAYYVIRAPFDGVMASVDVKKGDLVSSSSAAATIITKKRIADISMNEVDAVKVATGQKSTLTFDAIDGLSITGEVSQVDMIGEVSQGVVTYGVQITFDTEDSRVKPGMSVNAAIITEVKSDVLTVPSSAVKTSGETSYVEMVDGATSADTENSQGISASAPLKQQIITTGMSNDSSTEIVSGLNEGDIIITRTITPSSSAKTTSAPSLFGGGSRGGFR